MSSYGFNALHLPGWTITEFPFLNSSGHVLEFAARPDDAEAPVVCRRCPDGGRPKFHMRVLSTVVDAPAFGRRVRIHVDRKRYRCRCGWTGYATVPDLDEDRRMTTRCRAYVIERSALYPFAQVAKEVGLSETTVRTMTVATWIGIPDYEFKTPRYLGIDEIILRDSEDVGNPGPQKRAVFVDLENGRVLGILKSNTKKAVSRWISNLPDRHRVRLVTTDFELTYREAVKFYLPDARVIIDKWHAMKGVWDALDAVRVEVLRKHGQRVFNDAETLRMRNMLRARAIKPNDKGWLVLEAFLNQHGDIRTAHEIKTEFCEIWDKAERAPMALMQLLIWRDRVAKSPPHIREHFAELKGLLDNNMFDVMAYFDFPLTNATTEAMNRIIRRINGAGQGLRFDALTYRVRAYSRVKRVRNFICDQCLRRQPLSRLVKHKVMIDGVNNAIFDQNDHSLCKNCYDETREFIATRRVKDFVIMPKKPRVATLEEMRMLKQSRKKTADRVKTGRPFIDMFGYS